MAAWNNKAISLINNAGYPQRLQMASDKQVTWRSCFRQRQETEAEADEDTDRDVDLAFWMADGRVVGLA